MSSVATVPRPVSGDVRVIEPRPPRVLARLRETWRFRALIGFFAMRSAQKLYMRTFLGILWLPLRPAIFLTSQILIFGGLLNAPSEGKPYAVFFIVGSSAWEFFHRTAYFATRSLEFNRRVLRRVYVPRLIVVIGSAGAGTLVYAMYLVITAGFAVYYYFTAGTTYFDLGLHSLLIPLGLVLCLLIAYTIGLWLAIYSVQARDVRWSLHYALSFWFIITPVIYPLSDLHGVPHTLAQFNPMTAPIEMIRLGFLGVGGAPPTAMLVTAATILFVGGGGLWFFNNREAAALDSL